MQSASYSSNQPFTRLHARIAEEDGAFTVTVRMVNHLDVREGAWGEEIASSIELATCMITAIAKQFEIPQNCVSLDIVMDKYSHGTFH